MVNSSEYMKVTYKQIVLMKHTIGFANGKVTGTKQRKYVPYRNYFADGGAYKDDLEGLVGLGFMEKSSANYYHVTADGRTFLGFVTGVTILPESD